MDDCCAGKSCELERLAMQDGQRRVLQVVMAINAALFAIEFSAGLIAGSAALMADSLDMFGDALVYALSLYALSRSDRWKAGAALAKGGFILFLGCAVLANIAVKMASGVPPPSDIMLIFGELALAANLVCLRLLGRFRDKDVNMASTFECSRNDVLANLGVLIAAGGVALTSSPWPDLVIGALIAALFLKSAAHVIGAAWPALKTA